MLVIKENDFDIVSELLQTPKFNNINVQIGNMQAILTGKKQDLELLKNKLSELGIDFKEFNRMNG